MATATPPPMTSEKPIVELLLALRDIAGEAVAIDLDDEAAAQPATEHLAVLLARALDGFAALQVAQGDEVPELALPDLDAVYQDAWTAPAYSAPRISDVCFAGGLELRRVQRELAGVSEVDRPIANETAKRKLRRAIRAVLEAARDVHDVLGGEHRGHHQVADVASGLAVRRLYATFRRSLRDAADGSPEAVLAAVRYAGGAMATLVASQDYPDVRASDRAILRELRERALRWARSDRGVASGLHLLLDVRTCGDLMRGINQRQELRTHDRAVIESTRNGPGEDLAAWLARLEALVGLDDLLDELIARASTDPTAISAIIVRLKQADR